MKIWIKYISCLEFNGRLGLQMNPGFPEATIFRPGKIVIGDRSLSLQPVMNALGQFTLPVPWITENCRAREAGCVDLAAQGFDGLCQSHPAHIELWRSS